MKKNWYFVLWIGLSQSIFVLPFGALAKERLFDQTDIETKKIEFLLKEVEQLKGAKIWRNGAFYSPKEAADYLRMKMQWRDRGKPIRTAKDFIEKIASISTMSRKPYQIYFDNGARMEMKTFLDEKLNSWKE